MFIVYLSLLHATIVFATSLSPFTEQDIRPYVINLDRRPERWECIQRLLGQHNLSASRIQGVDAYNIPFINTLALLDDNSKWHLNNNPHQIGHVGALYSHIQFLVTVARQHKHKCRVGADRSVYLVMEDDFFPRTNFTYWLLQSLNVLPDDWDMYLFCWKCQDNHWAECMRNNHDTNTIAKPTNLTTVHFFEAACGYTVNPKSITRILQHFPARVGVPCA